MQVNRLAFQTAATDDKVSAVLAKSVRPHVMDNDIFWQKNEGFLQLLKPISSAILKIEADDALLSDALRSKMFLVLNFTEL
jgi:hypothetical protein